MSKRLENAPTHQTEIIPIADLSDAEIAEIARLTGATHVEGEKLLQLGDSIVVLGDSPYAILPRGRHERRKIPLQGGMVVKEVDQTTFVQPSLIVDDLFTTLTVSEGKAVLKTHAVDEVKGPIRAAYELTPRLGHGEG